MDVLDLYLEVSASTGLDPQSALVLAYRNIVRVDYTSRTDRCGHCRREVRQHRWRAIDTTDPGLAGQGGVLDCGIVGEWW